MASEYIFDADWEGERARMQGIEALWDSSTQQVLENLGPQAEARCLELGAGAGSVMGWMAQSLAPAGEVTAVDLDTRFLDPGMGANIVEGDILTMALAADSYDLIHARLLLCHLPDRLALIDKLAAALKPGGYLVTEDYDFQTFQDSGGTSLIVIPDASRALVVKCFQAVHTVMTQAGIDAGFGRNAPPAMAAAGLDDVSCDMHAMLVRGGSPNAEFYRGTLETLHAPIVSKNLATKAEIDDGIALFMDPAFSILSPVMISTWGRKPLH